MKVKLSPVQACVIDALMKENAYLHESRLYYWSKVIQDKEIVIMSIYKPTVEFLKRHKFIISATGDDNRYVLNPEYSINYKQFGIAQQTLSEYDPKK